MTIPPPAGTTLTVPAAYHEPVLVEPVQRIVTTGLAPRDEPPQGVVLDATCGGGGHAAAILQVASPAAVILIDRDPDALAAARGRLADARCPVAFVHARFSQLASILDAQGVAEVACILADLGVSSHQLDAPSRGFSLRHDAILDMRMDPTTGPTAAEVLGELTADALGRILREYGEEPEARRIAEAIVRARPSRTAELARLVTDAMSAPARRRLGRRIHPATRTFQALRIHINGEFGELDQLLRDAPARLAARGRLGIISFHSLEDRPVKRTFKALSTPPDLPRGLPVPDHQIPSPRFRIPPEARGGVTASDAEIKANPRARSARLRVLERCAA